MQDLSLKEAAELCGVSPQTIRRRKDRLEAVGGITAGTGWHLTLDQLIAVGLTTKVRGDRDTPSLQQRLDQAEAHTREALLRVEALEAVLAAKDQLIETQAQALRLLEAAPTPPATHQPGTASTPAPHAEAPNPSTTADEAARLRAAACLMESTGTNNIEDAVRESIQNPPKPPKRSFWQRLRGR